MYGLLTFMQTHKLISYGYGIRKLVSCASNQHFTVPTASENQFYMKVFLPFVFTYAPILYLRMSQFHVPVQIKRY